MHPRDRRHRLLGCAQSLVTGRAAPPAGLPDLAATSVAFTLFTLAQLAATSKNNALMNETAESRQAAWSETRDHNRPLKIWLPVVRAGSGSDVFVQRLAAGLRRSGHDPVVQWFPHRYELMPWRLAKVPAPEGTDLIHTGSWQAFAFKRAGLPLVVTEHHYVEHPAFAPYRGIAQAIYHRLFIGRCLRQSYHCADAIVAVSQHTAQAMTARLGRRVDFIYNWIDAERYSATSSQVLREEGDHKFRLLFVGNPSRRKGSDILPELALMLGNAFEIRTLGGLRRDFHSRHTPANLVALERVAPDDMPAVYGLVDAVLVPARYEAFGYVALEAMACGLPVIGFDSTGTREICVNGETALLCPVEDLDALARNCLKLASDRALARHLGMAGHSRARAHFDENTAISSYLAIYRSLTSGH